MGRGDKKTKKGKIFKGSFGKCRPANKVKTIVQRVPKVKVEVAVVEAPKSRPANKVKTIVQRVPKVEVAVVEAPKSRPANKVIGISV